MVRTKISCAPDFQTRLKCKTKWLPRAIGMALHHSDTRSTSKLRPFLYLKRSPFQVEDPHIVYEVGIASTARAERVLPLGTATSGKQR